MSITTSTRRYTPHEQMILDAGIEMGKKEARSQLLTEIEEIIESRKLKLELEEPSLRQSGNDGSCPFFCSLCQMGELGIMERKTEDGKYFCYCSYWSDPHNAFIDRSGGKWLGWMDEKKAMDILETLPMEENFRNQALDDLKAQIQKMKE